MDVVLELKLIDQGKGTLMMVDEWYKGDFFEGKAQGYGRAERDDGEYYEGDWWANVASWLYFLSIWNNIKICHSLHVLSFQFLKLII